MSTRSDGIFIDDNPLLDEFGGGWEEGWRWEGGVDDLLFEEGRRLQGDVEGLVEDGGLVQRFFFVVGGEEELGVRGGVWEIGFGVFGTFAAT
jgi:hypothetical protein